MNFLAIETYEARETNGHFLTVYRAGILRPVAPGDSPNKSAKKRDKFPWLLLLIFLGSLYFFWVLPYQLGNRPVQVEFAGDDSSRH